ncbi:hypothetical protein Pyn_09460 [Prunus yedoensis var. nudiflora]|uniref:Uncharacterized protein n=1 Tax=Prunus yedoensis var. nudiflora TaxID=2094558 RepID=A0A314ULD1_PRUYE|nr:hypothetical protein Pyn_09460 [Prunus yedoensis var. nudiflora]
MAHISRAIAEDMEAMEQSPKILAMAAGLLRMIINAVNAPEKAKIMEKPKAQKMDGRPLNSIVRIAASFMYSWGTWMKRVVVAKQTHKMNSSIVVNWIGGGVIIPTAE